MKTNMNILKQLAQTTILILMWMCIFVFPVHAQKGNSITGEILNQTDSEAVAFANVALFDSTGNLLLNGTAASESGIFLIENVTPGSYRIQFSAIGFETSTKNLEVENEKIGLGTIFLPEKTLDLKDVDVVANRIRAKTATVNSTFFISQKMHDSSNTGADILKLIPGVQVDLQQNVSLQGSRNIIILVDGKERDAGYLRQLSAEKIDKVEIMGTPPAKYDASVSGVINIKLVHEKSSGTDGHIYLEVPSSEHEIFLQPAYGFNYGFGKINLFTSYNGDIRHFSITETYSRKIFNNPDWNEINSKQMLRQKTWSHRFHYGFDWFVNAQNQINFYAFYNPYSQELDGTMNLQTTGFETKSETAEKQDEDINRSQFYSLWYKHIFNETTGHELTLDMSGQKLDAENITTLTSAESGNSIENTTKPLTHSLYIKLDYVLPAGEKIKLNSGMQIRSTDMKDRNTEGFSYHEKTVAAFAAVNFTLPQFESNTGFRAEYWKNGAEKTALFFLPYLAMKYNLTNSQNLKLIYRQSVSYPGFYQLNPYVSYTDLFTVNMGNPSLEPEIHHQLSFEYSRTFKNNFLSVQLFRQQTAQVIRSLTTVNDPPVFESQKMNMGMLQQTGILLSGSLGFGNFGINPYLKIANVTSIPVPAIKNCDIHRQNMLSVETSLSAFATFKKGFAASANFQYNSPRNEIQGTSFSGALYFLSLEKSFANGFKIGLTTGAPFVKNFVYQGSGFSSANFSYHSKGVVNLSAVPLWFKLSYRFSSGKKREKIAPVRNEPQHELKKGF